MALACFSPAPVQPRVTLFPGRLLLFSEGLDLGFQDALVLGDIFIHVYIWGPIQLCSGLNLTLYSGIAPGGAQGTLCSARDGSWPGRLQACLLLTVAPILEALSSSLAWDSRGSAPLPW